MIHTPLHQKLKHWYHGEFILRSTQEIVDLSRSRYREELKPLPDNFNPPLIARIINPICRFWLRQWGWIIGTIIALGILIMMILDYAKQP